MSDVFFGVTKALMTMTAHLRAIGLKADERGVVIRMKLPRAAFYALAHEGQKVCAHQDRFGVPDTMRIMTATGYVEIEPEPVRNAIEVLA